MRRSPVTLYATRVACRFASLRTGCIGGDGLSGAPTLSQAMRPRSRPIFDRKTDTSR
jgi:hypothetical protein